MVLFGRLSRSVRNLVSNGSSSGRHCRSLYYSVPRTTTTTTTPAIRSEFLYLDLHKPLLSIKTNLFRCLWYCYCCCCLAAAYNPTVGFSIGRRSLAFIPSFLRQEAEVGPRYNSHSSSRPQQFVLFARNAVTSTNMPPPFDEDETKTTQESPVRRSPRRGVTTATSTISEPLQTNGEDAAASFSKQKSVSKVKGSKKPTAKTKKDSLVDSDDDTTAKKKKTAPKARKKRSSSESDGSSTPSTKKKKAPNHQVLTERDVIPKLWNAAEHPDSYTFKIASWNVAGLRALVKKDPDAIGNFVEKFDLDVLCLQETKLQEAHLDDPKVTLPQVDGYDAHYSCSTAKKGYSGTAAFIRKRGKPKQKAKQTTMDAFVKTAGKAKAQESSNEADLPIDVKYLIPVEISMKMGVDKHDQEGRIIVMDFPLFTAVNLYVPNSGQKLERLDYRTKEWDKDLVSFMQSKQQDRGVPVLWLGDLNVAHTNLEVWNDGAKHLPKQAGVTVEERESFQAQLDAGFIDAFRKLHPDAKGHYSYWSTRAGNRAPNKGLRLDYFVCDPHFFKEGMSKVVIRDSYMVQDQEGSDHCPVILEIEIKQ